MITDLSLYFLENAAKRLFQEAAMCRDTVCDDEKVFGLESEAVAIKEAARLLRRAREEAKNPPKPTYNGFVFDEEQMVFLNPAPHAAAPMVPSGPYKTFTIGGK